MIELLRGKHSQAVEFRQNPDHLGIGIGAWAASNRILRQHRDRLENRLTRPPPISLSICVRTARANNSLRPAWPLIIVLSRQIYLQPEISRNLSTGSALLFSTRGCLDSHGLTLPSQRSIGWTRRPSGPRRHANEHRVSKKLTRSSLRNSVERTPPGPYSPYVPAAGIVLRPASKTAELTDSEPVLSRIGCRFTSTHEAPSGAGACWPRDANRRRLDLMITNGDLELRRRGPSTDSLP